MGRRIFNEIYNSETLLYSRGVSIHYVSFYMRLPIHTFRHMKIHVKRDLQKRPNMSPHTHEECVYPLRLFSHASAHSQIQTYQNTYEKRPTKET